MKPFETVSILSTYFKKDTPPFGWCILFLRAARRDLKRRGQCQTHRPAGLTSRGKYSNIFFETAGIVLLLAGLEYLLYLRLAERRILVFSVLGGIDLVLCPLAYYLALPHVATGLGIVAVALINVAIYRLLS